MSEIVIDCNGTELKVGDSVLYGDPKDGYIVEIVEITESEGDYNDELGRAEMYPPKVKVQFPDGELDSLGTYDSTHYTWAIYPDGPDVLKFQTDDLEKVV